MMTFQHETGRYFLNDEAGKLIAEVTFQPIDEGRNYVIDHTYVDPILRGQGIAGKLVKAVVDQAREEGKKIEPLCSFARHEFETKPEYAEMRRAAPTE